MFDNSTNSPHSLGSNRGVLTAAEQLHKQGKSFALAIVASTKGSTYRKAGALALFTDQGATHSVISGGCLEANWHKAAFEVIARNKPRSLLLDTHDDDDLIFGSGSGCRGSMRVLIVPVTPDSPHTLYPVIAESFGHHQTLKLTLIVDATCCAHGVASNAHQYWEFGDAANAIKFLHHSGEGEHQVSLPNGERVTVAVLAVRPAPRVLLIGASVETPFLIRIGHSLGWHITTIDYRAAQLELNASHADLAVQSRPAAALDALVTAFDAALIMSHSVSTDIEALRSLATRDEGYVGLLGPPSRRDELLSQLDEAQRRSLVSRLHAPLGIRLGGDGPEPLALSIAAELQRFFHHG